MGDEYKEALLKAQAQLAEIDERRAALIRLIETLKVLAEDELYELAPPPGYEPEGLTTEIRKILSLTTVHLTPMQIRDALIKRGFRHSSPKNLLISVHTVIGRLENDLDFVEREGKRAYKATPSYGAPNSLANMLSQFAKLSQQPVPEQVQKMIQDSLEFGKKFNEEFAKRYGEVTLADAILTVGKKK